MIARLLAAAIGAVDFRGFESTNQAGCEQQEVETKTRVATVRMRGRANTYRCDRSGADGGSHRSSLARASADRRAGFPVVAPRRSATPMRCRCPRWLVRH